MSESKSKRGRRPKQDTPQSEPEPEVEPAAMERQPMLSDHLWEPIAEVLGLDTNIRLRSATIKLEPGKPVVVTVTQEPIERD